MIDQRQTVLQMMGKTIARHCITSVVTIAAVHFSLHFQSLWVEGATTFLGSLFVVFLMVGWSYLEKTKAAQLVIRYVKAALLLQSGASMEEVVNLAKQIPSTQALANATGAEVTTIVTAQPDGDLK